jgi:hypothetical protein
MSRALQLKRTNIRLHMGAMVFVRVAWFSSIEAPTWRPTLSALNAAAVCAPISRLFFAQMAEALHRRELAAQCDRIAASSFT